MNHDIFVRTVVRDAILSNVSAELDTDAILAVEDVSVSATEAACRNSCPLLDFDEYNAVHLA